MLEVTEEVFFKHMGPLNVHPLAQVPYVQGKECGISHWKLAGRDLIGKSANDVNEYGGCKYPVVKRYYFTTAFAEKVGIFSASGNKQAA